jgi:hypothetical protein
MAFKGIAVQVLSHLLHLANASPPAMLKRDFYRVKDRLLKKYGEPDGCDVQHIKGKVCFRCHGSGTDLWREDYCERCDGSGWWRSPKWICLDRWRFGRYVFHIPGEVSYTKPDPDVTRIEGFISHADYGGRSDEAFAWLCLLYGEWRLLWRWLTGSYCCGWQWRPWLLAQKFVCLTAWKWRDLNARCTQCGRRTGGCHILWCDGCCRAHSAAFDDVPF